jgi:hypothetical protein
VIVIDTPHDYGAPINRRLGLSSHLASDLPGAEGSAELMAFALSIGMKPEWIQYPGTHREHFDVFGRRYNVAVARGAKAIERMAFGRVLREKRAAGARP